MPPMIRGTRALLTFGESAIPNKRFGTQSKLSPPPTFNVDNQVIFSLSVRKNAIFSNTDCVLRLCGQPRSQGPLLLTLGTRLPGGDVVGGLLPGFRGFTAIPVRYNWTHEVPKAFFVKPNFFTSNISVSKTIGTRCFGNLARCACSLILNNP